MEQLLGGLGSLERQQETNTRVVLRVLGDLDNALAERERQLLEQRDRGGRAETESWTAPSVAVKALAKQHKVFHAYLSKYIKLLDKVFRDTVGVNVGNSSSSNSNSNNNSSSARPFLTPPRTARGAGQQGARGDSAVGAAAAPSSAPSLSRAPPAATLAAEARADASEGGTAASRGDEVSNEAARAFAAAEAAAAEEAGEILWPWPTDYVSHVHEMIAQHLCMSGYAESARILCEESGVFVGQTYQEQAADMADVVASLKRGEMEIAERWTRLHAAKLEAIGSRVPFELTRLRYLTLLQSTDAAEHQQALQLAQDQFPQFGAAYGNEIRQLAGCLMWAGALGSSPYAHMCSQDVWDSLVHTLVSDACRIRKLPRHSHLSTAFNTGLLAKPVLQRMAKAVALSGRRLTEIAELPGEIPLPEHARFHSIFSCPVSREIATEDNPAVLLKCGHVLCRNAMQSITKFGTRFKCPTCYSEMTTAETRVIQF